jgi:hypothetical protein|tara:strand:+ start:353 stop:526 length:174 start_codon:yes stop_codon:yes gene_type:complete
LAELLEENQPQDLSLSKIGGKIGEIEVERASRFPKNPATTIFNYRLSSPGDLYRIET